jgi:hypothetical protein
LHHPRAPPVIGPLPVGPVPSNPGMIFTSSLNRLAGTPINQHTGSPSCAGRLGTSSASRGASAVPPCLAYCAAYPWAPASAATSPSPEGPCAPHRRRQRARPVEPWARWQSRWSPRADGVPLSPGVAYGWLPRLIGQLHGAVSFTATGEGALPFGPRSIISRHIFHLPSSPLSRLPLWTTPQSYARRVSSSVNTCAIRSRHAGDRHVSSA